MAMGMTFGFAKVADGAPPHGHSTQQIASFHLILNYRLEHFHQKFLILKTGVPSDMFDHCCYFACDPEI